MWITPTTQSQWRFLFGNIGERETLTFVEASLTSFRSHRLAIAVIIETHISGQRAKDISSSLNFDNVCRSDDVGFRGGIWVLWNERDTNLEILSVMEQAIHTFVQVSASNPSFNWLFTAIYASPNLNSCINLWTTLPPLPTLILFLGCSLVISMRSLHTTKVSATHHPIANECPSSTIF